MSGRGASRERRRLLAALACLVLGTLLAGLGTQLPVLMAGVGCLLAFVVLAAAALLSPGRLATVDEDP
jgi:Na+/citrate or Na+/malate symporter